jgi:RNA polymerase sigma-70 factor, ECF subfamily
MHSRAFEETVLPHLDAAFNYARRLTRNDVEAEDVVQDACVRAMRFFSSLRDQDGRAWLFTIVRNTWYSRVARRAHMAVKTSLNDAQDQWPDNGLDPEERLLQQHTVALVRAALDQLPVDFREVIVLRDLDAYLDRELDADSSAAVREHVTACAACRRQLAQREALSRPLRGAPYYSAPDRLRAQVLAQSTRFDSRRRVLAWAAVAARARRRHRRRHGAVATGLEPREHDRG